MNLAAARQDIADALATVVGVQGYSNPPTAPRAGDAWPLLASLEAQGAPGLFAADWRVLLVLGGTPADGIAYLDDVLAGVVDALVPVGYVKSIAPVTLATSAGDLYAVELRMNRE